MSGERYWEAAQHDGAFWCRLLFCQKVPQIWLLPWQNLLAFCSFITPMRVHILWTKALSITRKKKKKGFNYYSQNYISEFIWCEDVGLFDQWASEPDTTRLLKKMTVILTKHYPVKRHFWIFFQSLVCLYLNLFKDLIWEQSSLLPPDICSHYDSSVFGGVRGVRPGRSQTGASNCLKSAWPWMWEDMYMVSKALLSPGDSY